MLAILLAASSGAAAQSMEGTPEGREAAAPRYRSRTAPPTAYSDETPANGVPGNGPFNNQMRKFSDPLGANGR